MLISYPDSFASAANSFEIVSVSSLLLTVLGVSIHLLQPAFAKLPAADDVEGERIQIRQVRMV